MNAALRAVTRGALGKGWEVFGVRNGYAGLLADQHHARVRVARAEHRLGRVGPQRAVLAPAGILANLVERRLGHPLLESQC